MKYTKHKEVKFKDQPEEYKLKEAQKSMDCLYSAKRVLEKFEKWDDKITEDKWCLRDLSDIYEFIALGKVLEEMMHGCRCNDDGNGFMNCDLISKELKARVDGINITIQCLSEVLAHLKKFDDELFERLDNSITHMSVHYAIDDIKKEMKKIKKKYKVDWRYEPRLDCTI